MPAYYLQAITTSVKRGCAHCRVWQVVKSATDAQTPGLHFLALASLHTNLSAVPTDYAHWTKRHRSRIHNIFGFMLQCNVVWALAKFEICNEKLMEQVRRPCYRPPGGVGRRGAVRGGEMGRL